MNDLIAYLTESGLLGAIIGSLLVTAIQFFLSRKFPQMAKGKVVALSAGISLSILAIFLAYWYFTSPLSDHRDFPTAQVEWRTEIKQADEPDTWPFKEPRYMLSCLGGDGEYSVYLVKVEDISFSPSRPRDFRPQYYGLKGSWNGWKEGETQLLDGQTNEAFKKYVDYSLNLCKEAEAGKASRKK